jgi:hypothetical protein
MRTKRTGKWLMMFAVMLAGSCGLVFAASQTTQHTVTATVPSLINITADTANFTLTFSDFVSGSASDTKTVNYTVKANNVTKTTGVVTGQLGALFTGIDLKASVGTYTKASGNARLLASTAGYVTILAASATNLADRTIDAAPGKTIRGILPITYRATATADLDAGTQSNTLTISFIDT